MLFTVSMAALWFLGLKRFFVSVLEKDKARAVSVLQEHSAVNSHSYTKSEMFKKLSTSSRQNTLSPTYQKYGIDTVKLRRIEITFGN